MTVQQLREALAGLPDAALVVMADGDTERTRECQPVGRCIAGCYERGGTNWGLFYGPGDYRDGADPDAVCLWPAN